MDFQLGLGVTLRVTPLIWGHGPNYGLPRIWVVTTYIQDFFSKDSMFKKKKNNSMFRKKKNNAYIYI